MKQKKPNIDYKLDAAAIRELERREFKVKDVKELSKKIPKKFR